MIKVRILATGEIKEVTPNVAFGLIDSKQAVKLDGSYGNRQMASNITENVAPQRVEEKKKGKRNFTYKTK